MLTTLMSEEKTV